MQQVAAEQRWKFGRVLGKQNPADLFTKYLDENISLAHTNRLKFEVADGRANDAPNLHSLSQSLYEATLEGKWEDWKWLKYITHGSKETERGRQDNPSRPSLEKEQVRTSGQVSPARRQSGELCSSPGSSHMVLTKCPRDTC